MRQRNRSGQAGAIAGAGIAMLPTYFVGDELQRGALVRVLPVHEPETLGIHAVLLSRQHKPLPLKLLGEFLAGRLGGKAAPWDLPPQRRGARFRPGQRAFASAGIQPR